VSDLNWNFNRNLMLFADLIIFRW